MEGPGKSVFVQYIKPDLGAARSRRIEVGESLHISYLLGFDFYFFFTSRHFYTLISLRHTIFVHFFSHHIYPSISHLLASLFMFFIST